MTGEKLSHAEDDRAPSRVKPTEAPRREASPPLRICHLVSGDLWAGAEAQALLMMTAMHRSADFCVSAVTLNPGRLSDELVRHGIPVRLLPEREMSAGRLALGVAGALRATKPEIVHSHRYKENLLATLATRGGRSARLVQTVHGVLERPDGRRTAKESLIDALNGAVTARWFARVLAVSRDIESRLVKRHGTATVRYVPNAIDVAVTRAGAARAQVRESFEVADGEILFGIVGRLVPIKGLEIFLAVAARVLERLPHARFLIVGDGPLRAELHERAAALGIGAKVTFTGHRDDVPDLIAALDVFAMTSWHEGMPVALLEAMALARPVVATAVGGIGEVIISGESGLLAPAGDVEALASRFVELGATPTRREAMGSAARARVVAGFSAQTLSTNLAAVYRDVVSGR